MRNNLLNHLDIWFKMLLNHFDKHKIQGRIFFAEIGLSILLWSVIVGIYTGEAIFDLISILTNCR